MALYKPSRTAPKQGKTYSLGKAKAISPKMPKVKGAKFPKPKTAKTMKVKL